VRNSILMVDFAKNSVHQGMEAKEAVVRAGQIRMRPIWVTDLTMMAGAVAILFDPIFQGMAISLLFGPIVATTLTLVVVPIGCMSASKALCPKPTDEEAEICLLPEEEKPEPREEAAKLVPTQQTLSSVAPAGEKRPVPTTKEEEEASHPKRKTG